MAQPNNFKCYCLPLPPPGFAGRGSPSWSGAGREAGRRTGRGGVGVGGKEEGDTPTLMMIINASGIAPKGFIIIIKVGVSPSLPLPLLLLPSQSSLPTSHSKTGFPARRSRVVAVAAAKN